MGLFDRLKMGLVLTKDSLLLIRHNPRLILFPAVSGIAGLAFLVIFLGITFGLAQINPEGDVLVGLLVIYLGLTFISSFFAAGLVHQTHAVLHGQEPSIRNGMAEAWRHKTPLLVWSVIAATVGIIINSLENSNSMASRIVGVLFGLAWTILTFFVIPVIVFEDTSTTEMFKRSASTFKETWGETPISLVAINLVGVVVALPAILLGFAIISAGLAVVGIALVLAGVLAGFLLSQTLQGVVKTALYVYATEGSKPSEFQNVEFADLAVDETRRGGRGSGPYGGGFH